MFKSKITNEKELKIISKEIRLHLIRSLASAGSGHTGGSLGLADIFSVLYFNILNHDPANPHWPERDRLILSIGHVAPVLYTTLAMAGYFSLDELTTLRRIGSRLQGHPGREHHLPGLELSAGSLGQGLSVSVGLALAAKMDRKSWRVYSIHGDGELQEGSIWEAVMSASHHKLDNLTAVVDRNYVQIDGSTEKVMSLEPLAKKWEAFGWHVITCDGHNHTDLIKAFKEAQGIKGQPSVIIAKTIMGRGVRDIENDFTWHGKAPTREESEEFLKQLEDYYQNEL